MQRFVRVRLGQLALDASPDLAARRFWRRRLAWSGSCQVNALSGLIKATWRLADELGWAKAYDGQYMALAQMLACKLVSVDERRLRGVARCDIAVRPRDL
jgi:predicted nucleic acid-binding protein